MKNANTVSLELAEIAASRRRGLEARLSELNDSQATEKKALHICINMSRQAEAFTKMDFSGNFASVAHRFVFVETAYFNELRAYFDSLSEGDGLSFLRYAFVFARIRHCFLEEKKAALESGALSAAEQFEERLIVSMLEAILTDMREYAENEGIIPKEEM